MKKKIGIIILIVVLIAGIISYNQLHNQNDNEVINVSAAASLQGALSEIETNFEAKGYDLNISYGGSGTLVSQIQEGAPADIFISASQDNFDNLKKTNDVLKQTNLLKNKLIVIGKKNTDLSNLNAIDKIAIGTPDAVPAGTYGVQALKNLNLYDEVKDKLVQTKDVSEVVTYVESENAQVGIVYSSDAYNLKNSSVLYKFAENTHDEIAYPAGLLTKNKNAQDFYDYLQSDEAMQVFEKYGFTKYE